MRRLILKLSLFLFITLLSNTGLIALYSLRNSQSYNMAILDKQQLLEQTPAPRLILVGGSATAFGMDSARLEGAFGLRVVNMGLQGGLGLRMILGMVLPQVTHGDIIVITPEYYHFFMDANGTGVVLQTLLEAPQLFYTQNTFQQWVSLVRNFLHVHSDATQHMFEDLLVNNCFDCIAMADPVFQRNSFDAHGDINLQLMQANPLFIDRVIWMDEENDITLIPEFWTAVNLLNDFAAHCRERGARVFLIYPPLRSSNYEAARIPLTMLYETLPQLLQFPVLGSPERYLFPDSEIYNTPYHLNALGTEHRTDLMIEDLEGAFNP